MNHLKTFESFDSNEIDEGLRSFVTGYASVAAKKKAKDDFDKKIKEIEDKVSKNASDYSFNKKALEKKAKENNYLGKLRTQKGGRDKNKTYVVYQDGKTGIGSLTPTR